LFHHLLTLRCDDKHHFAPIGPDPHRILDLGTGTGIWAIEMGAIPPNDYMAIIVDFNHR
jgi:ubiquinone/menaquinone biosynthesis C-methylase UbiE